MLSTMQSICLCLPGIVVLYRGIVPHFCYPFFPLDICAPLRCEASGTASSLVSRGNTPVASAQRL